MSSAVRTAKKKGQTLSNPDSVLAPVSIGADRFGQIKAGGEPVPGADGTVP